MESAGVRLLLRPCRALPLADADPPLAGTCRRSPQPGTRGGRARLWCSPVCAAERCAAACRQHRRPAEHRDPAGGVASPRMSVDCSGASGSLSAGSITRVTPGARVEARAVDLAGNESAAHAPQTIPEVCAPERSDAGLDVPATADTPSADAGAATPQAITLVHEPEGSGSSLDGPAAADTPSAPPHARRTDGCALSPGAAMSPRYPLWGLLALLLRRRAVRDVAPSERRTRRGWVERVTCPRCRTRSSSCSPSGRRLA